MITTKDLIQLADLFGGLRFSGDLTYYGLKQVCTLLAKNNPRFNEEVFLKAINDKSLELVKKFNLPDCYK